jgi:4-amino-4-deoxy-L-arabinose transferase-like glycosyltransferase
MARAWSDAEPLGRREKPGISPRSPLPGAASKTVWLLFGLAAAARAVYLFVYRPSLESYYLALAESLLSTGVLGFSGVPSTAFEPIYPSFLAAATLLFGERHVLIQLLQACMASAGAVLLYRLTMELTSSRRAAVWAGALFALHPLLIRQASSATDLAITTTLLAAFALVFVRIRDGSSAAVAGLILGVTVLSRSMVAPVIALAAAILLLRPPRRHAAVLALTAGAVIAPMVARTYILSGSLVPTRSGVALYVGNSRYTAALLPTYELDLLEPHAHQRFVRARPDLDIDDPRFAVEFDAFLTREALAHMAERPWRTVRQKMLNVAYQLSPLVTPFEIAGPATRVRTKGDVVLGVDDSVRRSRLEIAAHALSSLVLLVGCVTGVYLRRREVRRDAILWAIFATFAIVNAIYLPATRYTSPMQLLLMFYAAVALARLHGGSRHAAVA